jgi:hypothetical protein
MIKTDWKSIPTMGPDVYHEFDKIEWWAKKRYEEVGSNRLAIEIGSYHGRSSSLIAQYFNLISLDLWGKHEHSAFDTAGDFIGPFIKNVRDRDLLIKRIFPIISDSSFLEKLPTPLNADFAFIDGDHHYEPCRSDAFRIERHLSPSSYLIFHDFQVGGPTWPNIALPNQTVFPGIDEAVRDFLSAYPNYEVIEHYGGVLVVKKN